MRRSRRAATADPMDDLDAMFGRIRRDTLGISDACAADMVARWRGYAVRADAEADQLAAKGQMAEARAVRVRAAEYRQDADGLARQLG